MSSTDPRRPDGTTPGVPPGASGGTSRPAGSTSAGTSRPAGSTSAGPAGTGPADTPRATTPAAPEPAGPRTTGPGGHVVGVLIGIVLTAVALVLLALGMSRILSAGAGEDAVSPDALGMVLVTLGALVAGGVALLAVRTSTIPFAGGLLALVVGAAYLFAPVDTHRETVRLLATQQNREGVLTIITIATTGMIFTLGVVLLAAGFAASLVRRRGIAVGAFRERTRTSTGRR
ncbi:hypothetical protein [Cellulomonas sp. ATA003]|uniref:hypothetical protein n=1 Tax=Cellulomonas sp. ATA003 TaxID=3073064 RepID=UPI0028733646|nr:hypothetical protein [Cellulomonas sp. ATA003]WNB85357.1 hypothetical protein REH70_17435 [Cellulomonas sp. ATA003]